MDRNKSFHGTPWTHPWGPAAAVQAAGHRRKDLSRPCREVQGDL